MKYHNAMATNDNILDLSSLQTEAINMRANEIDKVMKKIAHWPQA